MFDVTSPAAQDALASPSDLMSQQAPMPTPNEARKPLAKKTPDPKPDLAPKLARKRSQDFTSKIQGWNSAGGGVLQQHDQVIVTEDPTPDHPDEEKEHLGDEAVHIVVETESVAPDGEPEVPDTANEASPKTPETFGTTAKVTPKASAAKKTGRDLDVGRGAWVRRKSKPQVEEIKLATTPKKRVVSDGHWRRDRLPKDDTPAKEKEVTPKPVTVRRSVVNVGMKIPPSHQDFEELDPEPVRVRPLRQARSRSRSRSADRREATPDYETSGTKVYIKRRRQSKALDHSKSESSFTDKPSSATDITTPNPSPPRDHLNRPVSEPRPELRSTQSREIRPKSARQSCDSEGALQAASDRKKNRIPVNDDDNLFTSSRSAEAYARKITEQIKKPSQPVAPAAPNIHGNRIEGWLANMPDPFTESSRSSLTPEPLDISKKASRRKPDISHDSGAADEHRRSSGRRRTSRQDADLETKRPSPQSESWPEPSPTESTALKRRGARRGSVSPVKGRGTRESTPANHETLMSGALPDPSANTSRASSAATQKFRIPSGGKQLPTILSVDPLQPSRSRQHKRHQSEATFDDSATYADGSVLSRASDGDSPRRNPSGLKRRATKHSDLMSVLSQSRDDAHPMASARSLRASRRKLEANTIGDVMNELSADELRYQRDLRTLVDGVIPVLLQHVLAAPEASPGSRVFSRPTGDTKPIVDMGVALERLRNTHKWIPMHEPAELLSWADSAAKVYSDYLKAWRLGYKDIVVNLAPAEQDSKKSGSPRWDDGLPRNKIGDLLDGAGERVDVAYLLKRPLVRLKHLTKTFRCINQLQPSANAEDMATKYQDLIAEAKRRVNDEQARLEDEAAASIDATRARDPRSLAPITGVTIDTTRSVRARDYFDMDLTHSSGQQLCCKIEIIYRDDAPDRGKSGDVLFCEVSTTGRWLLFPPLPASLVSARKGDRSGELVLMIRGFLSNARKWREVMSLRAEEDYTSADWLQMVGSSPMPPRLARKSSFNVLKEIRVPASGVEEPSGAASQSPNQSRDPSPQEVQVPLGERAKPSSRIWDGSDVNSVCDEDTAGPVRKSKPTRYRSSPAVPANTQWHSQGNAAQPAYFYDIPPQNRPSMDVRSKSEWTTSSVTTGSEGYSVWLPATESRLSDESSEGEESRPERRPSTRPGMHRRTSSVPSLDLPSIPKVRKATMPERPARSESPSSDRDLLPSQKRAAAERLAEAPSSAPSKLQKRRTSTSDPPKQQTSAHGPAPPAHSRPLSLGLRSNILPSFTPAFLKKNRRPSSPLKHEYEPSTASDSLSESDFSDLTDVESETSESTVEELPEEGVSTVGDLKAFQEYTMRGLRQSPPPASQPTLPSDTLAPSESASQAPYRTVPATVAAPAKTVANIFSWSDHGSWDTLHPEECQIFVTPGLIEAFDIAQANSVQLSAEGEGSTPSSHGIKPLVALELTPLVPLRRGTAVDISIRSPPTSNSLIRVGNNVMFRSRSPEECERLYALINRARIDNPTFIALQNARGPVQQSNWGEVMDRRNAARPSPGTSRSWWNLGSRKSGSYRSKGSRTLSIAATESSVGTMNTAFSALRRFSGGSRIFNIAKSTITSREGTRSTNSESLSSGAATPVPFDPRLGTPLGITNAKVRLYVRDTPSKWRDMGAARLTVMLPPRQDPTIAANPKATGLEKRILVYGKSKGENLLDVTLGESAFERVARTGIAVSVYEEAEQVAASGGVLIAKTTVYMIQMKSERDAAYTFGLVGKLRY